jgi:diguanylate cyclase (GGDEF)-like protein/PAS domain S-box-containing protein
MDPLVRESHQPPASGIAGGRPPATPAPAPAPRRTAAPGPAEPPAIAATDQGSFRALFTRSPLGMTLVGPDMSILATNDRFAEMLGYTSEELCGRPIKALLDPDQRILDPRMASAPVGGPGYLDRVPRTYLRSDGTLVDALLTVLPVSDQDGRPLGLGMVEDLRPARDAARTAEQLRDQLDVSLRAAGVVAWRVDLVTGRPSVHGDWHGVCGVQVPATAEEFIARVHPDDQALLRPGLLYDEIAGIQQEFRLYDDEGTLRVMEVRGRAAFDDAGEPVLAMGVLANITAQHRAARAHAEFAELVRRVIAATPDALIGVDSDGRVDEWNPAAERLFGWPAAEAFGEPLVDLVATEGSVDALHALLDGAAGSGRAGIDMSVRHRDGRLVATEVSAVAVPHDGELVRRFFLRDATQRLAYERELAAHALTDRLTGLPNRTLLLDRVTAAIERLGRFSGQAAVLVIDIDRIKNINESLGHRAGDQVLCDIAARLRSTVRPTDTVARSGSYEFAVLLTETRDDVGITAAIDRVRGVIAQPIFAAGRQIVVTASVGVASTAVAGVTAESLLRDADTAMYRAKKLGGDHAQWHDETLRAAAVRRLDLETDLRRALSSGQLEVWYQPIMSLAGAVSGLEALLRWRHPERGVVGPEEFVPLAEESGLIVPIGAWVLENACGQVARWRGQPGLGDLTVSVNLSGRQLRDGAFLAVVDDVLERHALPSDALRLEITESILMSDDTSADVVRELHGRGVRLAIDDFGTGYSSLTYLRRFPVSILKIDRSFVRDLTTDPADAAIVQALVDMAAALGLTACAEGVETEDQRAALVALGCGLLQGFHWAPPRPPAEMSAWLQDSVAAEAG